ncbi:hypothetical protein JKF63_01283 [Porcisia hertigi]|uniref:Uncharacterized protein n=1 Tax=Porcisia hertigi TaxID=2761500 RepID=A0A836IE51_9TRYP|nr:hypothetical protein JKF63_01283 [Porcisia hertigi]
MSSVLFCGIPCSPPNAWELHRLSPVATSQEHHGTSLFSLEVCDLKFYADFYNDHHKCCWPRVVLDAHLGKSADEVLQPQSRSTASDKVAHQQPASLTGPGLADGALLSVYGRHVAEVMEQLYLTQAEKLPRAALARRALFHQGVPPVLRCQEQSDDFVYVLSGRLQLFHACTRTTSPSYPHLQARGSCCTHGTSADDVARDVFPLVLVMAPGDDCVAYIDAEPPSASEATQWRTQPLVLALESVKPVSLADPNGVGEKGEVWCAAYTPFTWICNPLGNQWASVKSATAVRRRPRRQQRDAAKSRYLRGPGEEAPAALEPLRLSFTVYASQYTCEDAKHRIVHSLASSNVYNLHVTKNMRFGLGGADLYKRVMLGVDEEALSQARGRRPAQLMRLLDEKVQVVDDPASKALESGEKPEISLGDEAAIRAVGSPSLKVPRLEGDDEPSATVADAERRCSHAIRAVTTYPIAQLCTQRPLEREWCRLPNCTTLASVLPQPTRGALSNSGWPLRVIRDSGESLTYAAELSSLATLQDLATALRSVLP